MARMDALITPCACTKKKQGSIEFLTSQVSKEQAAQERQGIASGVWFASIKAGIEARGINSQSTQCPAVVDPETDQEGKLNNIAKIKIFARLIQYTNRYS